MAQRACKRASAVVGPTVDYVKWGLAHAGRDSAEADREFPFAYPSTPPSPAEFAEATKFWTAHGISKNDGCENVCFFGTLGRQFDLETVVVAARQLERAGTKIRFVLCGSGDREAHFRSLARSSTNVVFPGWVNAAQIWTLMRVSRIGLAPYLPTANFISHIPNKPIEYLSAGLPVLTTLSGTLGIMLLQHSCGRVYAPFDPDGLATTVLRLAENQDELARLSQNAAALYRARFTPDKVYTALVSYLERWADQGSWGHSRVVVRPATGQV